MAEQGEATSRPRGDRLVIMPGSSHMTLAILLETEAGAASATAMFAAAATEHRVRGLSGFVGAAFMTSPDDRFLLEIVQWESGSALAQVRDDDRYTDHVAILQNHSTVRQVARSSQVRVELPFTFVRGDAFTAAVMVLPESAGGSPADSVEPNADRLVHVAPGGGEGAHVTVIAKGNRIPPDIVSPGREVWRGSLRVIEAVSADPDAVGRPVHYRLLPASRERSSAALESTHA